MAHDVFISHSSKDKPVADAVCATLEAAGIRCWIAPRDIRPGVEWPEAIVSAINAGRVMVLIFSANSNNSKDVAKELTVAMNSRVIVIPFKIDDIQPKGVMQYYLSDTHWLDAMNPPTAQQVQELVETVRSLVGGQTAAPAGSPTPPGDEAMDRPGTGITPARAGEFSALTRPGWFWAGTGLLLLWLAVTVIVLVFFRVVGWRDAWHDPWYLNYLVFLALTLPLLIPAVYGLRRGMAGGCLAGPAAGTVPTWWWALPAVFGFAGGLVSWAKHRNTNRRQVLNMLTLGILLTPVWVVPFFLFPSGPGAAFGMSVIGHWPTSREAHSVFVRGDTAYIANGEDGLIILNVSDPSDPQQIGAYPLENAQNIILAGDIAYVADQGQVRDGRVLGDRLVIIDVAAPANPRKLGEYAYEGKHIHRAFSNLAVSGNTVYLTASDRLILVDVSIPAEPVTAGIFEFSSNIVNPGIAVAGDIAYVQANRLHVVDVSDPAGPVEVGGFDSGWGSSIEVVNDTAYIAGWDKGLTILDVSTPSRPVKLGNYRELVGNYELLPPGASGRQTITGVSVSGDTAYVTYFFGLDHGTWTDILESGIIAVNVRDPGNPRKAGLLREMDMISTVFATDDLVFAVDSTRGLLIYSKQ